MIELNQIQIETIKKNLGERQQVVNQLSIVDKLLGSYIQGIIDQNNTGDPNQRYELSKDLKTLKPVPTEASKS